MLGKRVPDIRYPRQVRDVYMLMIVTCRHRHTPMGADRIGGPLHDDRDTIVTRTTPHSTANF